MGRGVVGKVDGRFVLELLFEREPAVANDGLELVLVFGVLAADVVEGEEEMVVGVVEEGGQLDVELVVVLGRLVVVDHVDEDFFAVLLGARVLGEEDGQGAVLFFALHKVDLDELVG